jgi:hypothetical protein
MTNLTLSNIANIAEIIGASTIVTGLIIGWIQLRYYRIQRTEAIAQNLMQTFYSRDLARSISLMQNLPDGIGLVELRARGREYEEAAVIVTTAFETMGILVFKGIAPIELVADLAGGVISTMSRRLQTFQDEIRVEQDQPSWGEWFEWLGEQVERIKSEEAPAYIRYREWRP